MARRPSPAARSTRSARPRRPTPTRSWPRRPLSRAPRATTSRSRPARLRSSASPPSRTPGWPRRPSRSSRSWRSRMPVATRSRRARTARRRSRSRWEPAHPLGLSATVLTAATSNLFVVTAPAATITLVNSASVITWGNAVVLTIQFGANGANKPFILEGARDGVTWSTIANLTTNASANATYTYRPATNLYYRARFTGTPDLSAGNSNTTRTVVRQIALLRPPNSGAIRTLARNTSIKFTTTVRPSRPELPAAKVSFVFYKRIGGVWTFVTKRDVYINSLGKASTTFKFTSAGSWYVRSRANPPPYNAK